MLKLKEKSNRIGPYGSFLVIHLEVGENTKSFEYQEAFWPAVIDLVALSDRYGVKLTLQLNPQWAEFILKESDFVNIVRGWQEMGHEVGLHHHGYDHGDWNGYTNRPGKEDDPRFRGSVRDMMKLIMTLVHLYEVLSGTVTDEEFDYPVNIKYDTEGIRIYHARSNPKRVTLGGNDKVIQVSMAFLPWDGDVETFKREYQESRGDEIFGVVTHEKDFAKNPAIIQEWFKFVQLRGGMIKSVHDAIVNYENLYGIKQSGKPLTFLKDVKREKTLERSMPD